MTDTEYSMMAELIGGPMDGDTIILSPTGSVTPPSKLVYAWPTVVNGDQPKKWLEYQARPILAGWPRSNVCVHYEFTSSKQSMPSQAFLAGAAVADVVRENAISLVACGTMLAAAAILRIWGLF
jgi:hypothetical protein